MKYNALLHGSPAAWDVARKPHKGGGGGDSVTKQEIPAELKPLAKRYTTEATRLFDTPYQAYEGQRYADMNPLQTGGLSMAANRAIGGDAVMNAGYGNIQDTLSGRYLDPESNPWLQKNVQNAMNQTMGTLNSQFNSPGAFGSSAHEGVAANQLGNVASQMYGQNYAQERANQMNSLGLAPTYGNMAYDDAERLMSAGQIMQDEQQKGMDWNLQQFMEQQEYPYKNLAAAAGVFNSNLGGTSTTNSSGGGK